MHAHARAIVKQNHERLTEFEDVHFSRCRLQLILVHGEHTSKSVVGSRCCVRQCVAQLLTLIRSSFQDITCLSHCVGLLAVLEEQGLGGLFCLLHAALWIGCAFVDRCMAFTNQY